MSLFQYYRHLLKARTIEDTPSAKIRSVAQGYAEITGKQYPLPKHDIIAPLSHTPCTWYRYEVYKKSQKNHWTIISQGQSSDRFMIKDSTGFCVIDPKGADIHPNSHDTWCGFSANPQGKSKRKIILILGLIFGGYKYTESRMEIDSPIYALGNFETIRSNQAKKHDVVMNIISQKGLTARQPYLITNFTAVQLAQKYRLYSTLWLVLFLIFMPYSLWWLSIKL